MFRWFSPLFTALCKTVCPVLPVETDVLFALETQGLVEGGKQVWLSLLSGKQRLPALRSYNYKISAQLFDMEHFWTFLFVTCPTTAVNSPLMMKPFAIRQLSKNSQGIKKTTKRMKWATGGRSRHLAPAMRRGDILRHFAESFQIPSDLHVQI